MHDGSDGSDGSVLFPAYSVLKPFGDQEKLRYQPTYLLLRFLTTPPPAYLKLYDSSCMLFGVRFPFRYNFYIIQPITRVVPERRNDGITLVSHLFLVPAVLTYLTLTPGFGLRNLSIFYTE